MRNTTARKTRPYVTMPVDSDESVYLTGCTDKPANSRDDEIRIRFKDGPGFMPSWIFSWIMRFMQSPRTSKTEDDRVRQIAENEFVFTRGRITAHAVKYDDRILMKVVVRLRDDEGTFERELDSVTCAEIEKRITDMRSALNRYDGTKAFPEIADDESRWFESFDKSASGEPASGSRSSENEIPASADASQSA